MKYALDLAGPSPEAWVETVMADFNRFLQDHADCERKASAMAMSFVAKAPDKKEIIPELIDTAIEELEHFRMVYDVMARRGVPLRKEIEPDEYVNRLIQLCRSAPEERFIDRMLLASVLECRGAERFRLIADALEDEELKRFYKMLWTSEAKHGNIFVKMLLNYYPEDEIYPRLQYLMEKEYEILLQLPIRPALH